MLFEKYPNQRKDHTMSCDNFIREMRFKAAAKNIDDALAPFFRTLQRALPLLDDILIELRGDDTTDSEFQEFLVKILDENDYSAKTLCGLMFAYGKTHNDSSAPNRKPIVAFAQESYKLISSIDDIFEEFSRMSEHNKLLQNIIIHNTP